MSLLQNSNAISSGGYNIANSLRFQQASSQFLNRTPGSASNRKTWTWSGWVKRGNLATGAGQILFSTGPTGAGQTWNQYYFETDNRLTVINFIGGSASFGRQSDALYRDPSAWYHVVIAFDTTQATDTNRIKFYINGTQITTYTAAGGYSAWPSLNYDGPVNNTVTHGVGGIASNSYLDGYLSEVNFVDGQALTPSSFGETNTLTGQWVAKKYNGTYGTNGFYLPFSNGTSTTTLGADSSGNGNNWTLNNFTRSAGVSDCWMNDVPSGNGSSVGGTQPNSNYAVWNQLNKTGTISNASLNATQGGASSFGNVMATLGVSSGKFYWEVIPTTSLAVASCHIGITNADRYIGNLTGGSGTGFQFSTSYGYEKSGTKINNNTYTAYGASFAQNDVIGIALDLDAGTIVFYKNGVSQGTAFSGLSGIFAPLVSTSETGTTVALNAGQRSFAYTPPSGFKALCTANLPAATIKKGNTVFDAVLWTGDGTTGTGSVTGLNFQPDVVWAKRRSGGLSGHVLNNSIVGGGANTGLSTSSTDSEASFNANATFGYLSSFNPNGFNYFGGSSPSYFSANTLTYVAWCWDAGSSTVTNTNGTISSQVRANPTAGVSVVTYTGTGANATVGHGLGVAPSMIIVKGRNYTGDVQNWMVYHKTMTATSYMYLNLTNSKETFSTMWNNTNPTATVFSIGTNINVNANTYNYVAYCFAEIAGFSRFGSYTGNGSADGPFVYTGFRPKFVMIKRTDTTGNWAIHDTSRSPFNQIGDYLLANAADAEVGGSVLAIDALSNGFKLRVTQANENASGGTYIYACFAESPFASSNAR